MEDSVVLNVKDDVFYHEEDTLTVCVDIFMGSVLGMEGQEGVYLEDVEGT